MQKEVRLLQFHVLKSSEKLGWPQTLQAWIGTVTLYQICTNIHSWPHKLRQRKTLMQIKTTKMDWSPSMAIYGEGPLVRNKYTCITWECPYHMCKYVLPTNSGGHPKPLSLSSSASPSRPHQSPCYPAQIYSYSNNWLPSPFYFSLSIPTWSCLAVMFLIHTQSACTLVSPATDTTHRPQGSDPWSNCQQSCTSSHTPIHTHIEW